MSNPASERAHVGMTFYSGKETSAGNDQRWRMIASATQPCARMALAHLRSLKSAGAGSSDRPDNGHQDGHQKCSALVARSRPALAGVRLIQRFNGVDLLASAALREVAAAERFTRGLVRENSMRWDVVTNGKGQRAVTGSIRPTNHQRVPTWKSSEHWQDLSQP